MNYAEVVVALTFALSVTSCTRLPSPAQSKTAAAPNEAPAPVTQAFGRLGGNPIIIELISRDQTIIIAAGPNEPLYSIQSGKRLIACDLSMDDLRTLHPDVYQRLMSGYARGESFEWAGMNVDHYYSE